VRALKIIERALEPRLREKAERRMKAGRPCAESAQGLNFQLSK
jgi:hypothetical protein